ncbi:O-antigen polymerase [Pectobacterium versatile]|uniref:O-antigen polymerase n=1 Tax=Pectobacterium versatile TaxID=2488639 RepID=UPI001934D70A|nr:O-antigen polymerase [Pectobacterium versatile]QQK72840.1 oligosaccharide repeat unit polymerase [Pectobacterium versatile]
MAFLFFSIVTVFYVFLGFVYMANPDLEPLGAMGISGVPEAFLLVFIIGYVSVGTGYAISTKRRNPTLRTISSPYFQSYCSLMYLVFSLVLFFWGVSYYGGYVGFISTPYSAILEVSDNELKDVLISSSGLLAVFSILSAFSGDGGNKKKYIISLVSLFVLLSVFFQGRRETLVLLMITFLSYKFIGEKLSARGVFKSIAIGFLVAFAAGVGLYLRETTATSGGNILSAISYAILYETHFTIATLGNEIKIHLLDGRDFLGIGSMFQPILFIIPGFIFSLLGLDKAETLGLGLSEPKFYDDKGGSFIFSHGIHSLGYIGVVIDGLVIGFLLSYFYKIAKNKKMIFFHFPIVSLILVATRKDVTYGIKYISLQFMAMLFFYLIYKCLPKKNNI